MGELKFAIPLEGSHKISSSHGTRIDPMQFKLPEFATIEFNKYTKKLELPRPRLGFKGISDLKWESAKSHLKFKDISKLSTIFDEPINDPKHNYLTYYSKHIITYMDRVYKPIKRFHSGMDYPVPIGTKVFASESGRVVRASRNEYLGKLIIIDHTPKAGTDKNHLYSLYAHLSKYAAGIKLGARVLQGQEIALSGDTGGSSTGAHLHFAIVKLPGKKEWNPIDNTGVVPNRKQFIDPECYLGSTLKVDGTIYDLTDEELATITKHLDVQMYLDFAKYSWYGYVYLGDIKVGRIDKDNLNLMAGLSLEKIDEILKTTKTHERETVVVQHH